MGFEFITFSIELWNGTAIRMQIPAANGAYLNEFIYLTVQGEYVRLNMLASSKCFYLGDIRVNEIEYALT